VYSTTRKQPQRAAACYLVNFNADKAFFIIALTMNAPSFSVVITATSLGDEKDTQSSSAHMLLDGGQ
jgi:hypothetical protein